MKYSNMLALCCLALAAAPAAAAAVGPRENLGFENGTFDGWTAFGVDEYPWLGPLYSNPILVPEYGEWFGLIETSSDENIYGTLSRSIWLKQGETLHGQWAFIGEDFSNYNDDGYLKINGETIFERDIKAYGDYGDSGWLYFDYRAATSGNYLVEIGVRNIGDAYQGSGVAIDISSITGVPETATWAMLIAGFGMIGFGARRKRQAAA
jgi:hypothetical protein